MKKVTMAMYLVEPTRYELRSRKIDEQAPSCSYGNRYEWIGYDHKTKDYVRFSKRAFKKLLGEQLAKKEARIEG